MEHSKWTTLFLKVGSVTPRHVCKKSSILTCISPVAPRHPGWNYYCLRQLTPLQPWGARMILETDNLKLDNARLAEDLRSSVLEAQKIVSRLETKNRRLYDRNDHLERLLRQHSIPVPDWPRAETGGV